MLEREKKMMKRRIVLAVSALLALAVPATALTFKGNVPNGGTRTLGIGTLVSGNFLFTLAWSKPAADLDLILDCGGESFGMSVSTEQQFERLEVGLFAGIDCTLVVSSFSGGSKFWVNLQFTGDNIASSAPEGRSMAIRSVSPESVPELRERARSVSALKRQRADEAIPESE
jgi:hypothetical protein